MIQSFDVSSYLIKCARATVILNEAIDKAQKYDEIIDKTLGDAEHAKMYSQYEILGVFKQNDETGDIIKIWEKPIPHDNYQIIIKKS